MTTGFVDFHFRSFLLIKVWPVGKEEGKTDIRGHFFDGINSWRISTEIKSLEEISDIRPLPFRKEEEVAYRYFEISTASGRKYLAYEYSESSPWSLESIFEHNYGRKVDFEIIKEKDLRALDPSVFKFLPLPPGEE